MNQTIQVYYMAIEIIMHNIEVYYIKSNLK